MFDVTKGESDGHAKARLLSLVMALPEHPELLAAFSGLVDDVRRAQLDSPSTSQVVHAIIMAREMMRPKH